MTIDGWTAPGFEGVREVFAGHFANGAEIGASFAAYHRGRPVVDLWGGIADPETERPWTEDAVAVVFSTTKGFTAVCAHLLAQHGRLDVEGKVAECWPELATDGKEDLTVAHLLAHQAGLPWVDEPLTLEDALAWDPMIAALERQAPVWAPGARHGYHAVTYGYLVGEVVRRIDGRSVGTFLREEVADPLGLDLWIGLPEEQESRVAALVGGLTLEGLDPATRALIDEFVGPRTPLGRSLRGGGAFDAPDVWNTRALRAAEVPAAGGVADARSVARLYAACISEVDGIRLLTPEQVALATTQRTSGPNTLLLDLDVQFGLGFMVPSSLLALGGPRSFGHFGLGGSVGWADPEADLAFGYVMNKMELGLAGDARSYTLVQACYDALR
jgi:CubicO group peptidase (beta-lactamase class C family)